MVAVHAHHPVQVSIHHFWNPPQIFPERNPNHLYTTIIIHRPKIPDMSVIEAPMKNLIITPKTIARIQEEDTGASEPVEGEMPGDGKTGIVTGIVNERETGVRLHPG